MFGRLLGVALAALAPAHPYRVVPAEPVPILMYHVVAAPPAGAPFPGLYVAPAAFAAQVRWLSEHGYHAVTLDRVLADWQGREGLPPKPIVLSFDDGYRSDFTVALPDLHRIGWAGDLNLLVANERPVWGLRPGELRRLRRAGWELDAHTLTHPDLTRVGRVQLWREVRGSRLAIRRRFHVPVLFFAYPSGRYDAAVVAAVRRAGFAGATTTDPGTASPREGMFALDRIRVSGGESLAAFAASLRGGP